MLFMYLLLLVYLTESSDLMYSERKARLVSGSDPRDAKFLEEFGENSADRGGTEPARRLQLALSQTTGPALLKAFGDRCISSSDRSHEYTLCLFANITQKDSNNDIHLLGVWASWIDEHTMAYIAGDICPNGNNRNVTIHLECGKTNLELSRVTEPRVCQYDATLDLPIDCEVFTFSAYDYSQQEIDSTLLDSDQNSLLERQVDRLTVENQKLKEELTKLALENTRLLKAATMTSTARATSSIKKQQ